MPCVCISGLGCFWSFWPPRPTQRGGARGLTGEDRGRHLLDSVKAPGNNETAARNLSRAAVLSRCLIKPGWILSAEAARVIHNPLGLRLPIVASGLLLPSSTTLRGRSLRVLEATGVLGSAMRASMRDLSLIARRIRGRCEPSWEGTSSARYKRRDQGLTVVAHRSRRGCRPVYRHIARLWYQMI